MAKSIENLPEKIRKVYQLSRRENLSYKEISAQLNIPVDTVEKQMGKAIRIIRTNLKDFTLLLILLAEHGFE